MQAREQATAGSTRLLLSAPLDQDPSSPLVVLAQPAGIRNPPFVTNRVSYSSHWDGPVNTTHVLVDGLMNGWIGSKPLTSNRLQYSFDGIIVGVELATGVAVSCLVCFIVGDTIRRRHLRTVLPPTRIPR